MLRLDANGGYASRPATRHALSELADAGVDLVEQPLLGLSGLVEARRDSPVAIMADEACWSAADALALVAHGAADALSVYVGKAGGLGRARDICAVAAAAGIPHDLNGALELGIGNAANLQLALASPAGILPSVVPVNAPAGMKPTQTAGRYFDDDIVVAAFGYEDGELLAPDAPGLGIEVDVDKVKRYCVHRQITEAGRRRKGGMRVGVTCGGVWWPDEYFQAVDQLGFDSLWTGEHIVFHRPILDAIPLLAGVAAVTKRLRLGPAAIMAPLRHPTMLAKELTTLDIISGGRLDVVIGAGGDYPKEFEACQVPMAGRGKRTTETIEIMREYWTQERFSYAGEIFQLEDVWMSPRPVQPGGPPVWIAGRSNAAITRAARLGDGYATYMYTADRCASAFAEVDARAAGVGRSLRAGFTRSAFVYVSMDDSPQRARELGIRDLSWRYGKDFSPWIDKYCVSGTPDAVIAGLQKFATAGVEHLALGMIHEESFATDTAPSRVDTPVTLATIERFATELLPALQRNG